MSRKRVHASYDMVAIGLHWCIAALIVAALTLGELMPGTGGRGAPYALHASLGFAIMSLTVVRLIWRLTHAQPRYPALMPRWQIHATKAMALALYALSMAVPMSRPLRIEFPGAVYHVTSRGNAQGNIFIDNSDRDCFLDVFTSVVRNHRWICHAYCLMGEHYHLLIETPEGNLARGMRQLNGIYTQKFNRNHNRAGHLFQGRYKAILVEKERYLLELCRYIVLNPVKAGMAKAPEDWEWSSYMATGGLAPALELLSTDWILSQFGSTPTKARAKYLDFVYAGMDRPSPWKDLRGGVLLGDDRFVARFTDQLSMQETIGEIPKNQRLVHRPTLEDLFCGLEGRPAQQQSATEAHLRWGYTLKQIAELLGVHYATVSRMVKAGKEKL